ncbi:MAG: tRNA pseudouridine(38-40) synthase TruA [Anaerolineae bacterium]
MAVVEYDGTEYHGSQFQANAPTIQGAMEQALAQVSQEHVQIRFAGRTDAGVHATGQVADFRITWRHTVSDLQRAWNAMLPADIAIRQLRLAPPGFHSRHSACGRVYRYSIWNHPVRSPLHRRTHWHVMQRLDAERMSEAGQVLVGEHDFRAFGAPVQPDGPTVRRVERIAVWRENDEVFVEVEANAFLRRMARRIAAALASVGQGRLTREELANILGAADPAGFQGAAPAHGLCLVRVEY